MKRAVILVRASSSKQANEGDPLEQQLEQCRHYIKKQDWKEIKVFALIESGALDERKFFQEVLSYAIDRQNKVDFLVFKNISRFTRGGGVDYIKWKTILENNGVRITDIYNTIGEKINTLEHLGFAYEWSSYSPSESNEINLAEQAKADRRNILTQMISAEIVYTNQGYYPRVPPYGYKTQKIETEHGKRTILIEVSEETFYIKKVFKMKTQGFNLSEIANEINNLGYKSRIRIRNRRDKRTKQSIGKIGETPATSNTIAQILDRTIYAGIICEKWTRYQPVKAKFPGFIDVNLFNQANKDKILLQISENKAFIFYGKEATKERTKKRIMKNNPKYPFKRVVLCPVCKHELRGSASKGRSGQKYEYYHCSHNHKQWSVKASEFNQNIYSFIKQIRFDDDHHKMLEELFHEKWDGKRINIIEKSQAKESYVNDLLVEQKSILQSIKQTSSGIVREALETDYENLEIRLKLARKDRDRQVKKEIDAKLGFQYARYFMEHLEELLIDTENVRRQEQLFGMMFTELPTYSQIMDGTAKLVEYFRLANENISSCDLDRNRTDDLLRDRETC